jgi:hypothetical protein
MRYFASQRKVPISPSTTASVTCRVGADLSLTQSTVAGAKVQSPQNWHQHGTSISQKTKKSAGENLLTSVFYGSPTWARTRDLRINSPALYQLSYRGTASNYSQLLSGP